MLCGAARGPMVHSYFHAGYFSRPRWCALAQGTPQGNQIRAGLWVFALVLGLCNVVVLGYMVRGTDLTLVDFSTFVAEGKLLNAGMGHRLYELAAQEQMQLNPRFQRVPLPFIHAPYEAVLFSPLALVPYPASYYAWNLGNLALLALMAARLRPWLKSPGTVSVPLLFTLSLAYWPNAMVLFKGQDSILLALVMTEAYVQCKAGREERAGVILALGLFKFHTVLPLVACFALNRQWKLVKSFCVAGSGLAAISVAMIGTGGVRQYFDLLRSLDRMPLAIYIKPEQMPNLRGFLSTMMSATPQLIWMAILVAYLAVILGMVLSLPGQDRGGRFDLFFACATAMGYALSYHSYEHDMAPLLPGLLLAANAAMKAESKGWRWACIGLVAALFFTPFYLYLFSRDMLCLMCVPLVALIFVIPMVARSVGAEAVGQGQLTHTC